MRLTARLHDKTAAWLENELLLCCRTYQERTARAGISRMTLYFLLNPGLYGGHLQWWRGAVRFQIARAIVHAFVGPDGGIAPGLAHMFVAEHGHGSSVARAPAVEEQQ